MEQFQDADKRYIQPQKEETLLQVLIVAYGREGIESVASLPHPRVDGVEYIVSWQTGGCIDIGSATVEEIADAVPPALSGRDDFHIFPSDTRGVSVNRNLALDLATSPLALYSDDDVAYTPEDLRNVIKAFRDYPDADFIAFEFRSDIPKFYPAESFDMRKMPKGYVLGGPEMAFRTEAVRRHGLRFNEWFGIGCEFPSGEEDVFLADALSAGLDCRFVPLAICRHDGDSTGDREILSPKFIRTKGAIFTRIHPHTWPIRMILHAIRTPRPRSLNASITYCRHWIKGVIDSRRLKVF